MATDVARKLRLGKNPLLTIKKTSISVVRDARFLMSWFIIKIRTKQLESHDNV